MSYVLSVIYPPVAPAAFGKARCIGPMKNGDLGMGHAANILSALGVPDKEANVFVVVFTRTLGVAATHEGTGLTFRLDKAADAPHPCPCCERLVLPEDHAYAYDEDAYCLGCFTWSRDKAQCLPVNTAHTKEP
jgi:hypothetical protein